MVVAVMVVADLPLGLHIIVLVALPIILIFHQLQLLLELECVGGFLCFDPLVLSLHLQFQFFPCFIMSDLR